MTKFSIKLILFVLIGFIVIISLYILFNYYNSPPTLSLPITSFTIHKDESIRSIAHRLYMHGFIRSQRFFFSLVKIRRKAPSIKSGEYQITRAMKNTDMLQTFVRGNVINVRFTIPEGFTINQIANMLQSQGIVSKDAFLAVCADKNLLKKYHIPFKTAEGFLFPDTYFVAKGLTASQIVQIMMQKFYQELTSITHSTLAPNELKKIVIIASLVEKEAKHDDERPVIAAVFYNRLKKGKRLESCATVQYVLSKTKKRLLYSDLRIKSPYNTYLHKGLPPGPIANPGRKSLIAALHPATVSYLFFVSRHDGSHYFSTSYQEHLKAIQKYREYNRVGVQSQ